MHSYRSTNHIIIFALFITLISISLGSCSSSTENEAYLKAKQFEMAGYDQQVVKWYFRAAEQEHVESQFILGKIYQFGKFGQSKDLEEAMYWYDKAAALGHAQAHFELASGYGLGRGGLPKDRKLSGNIKEKGFELLQAAATRGEPSAQLALSEEYKRRNASDKSDEWKKKAIALHIDLAESGEVKSQMWLANQYKGKYWSVTGKNLELAFKWLSKAAESGDAHAQYLLSKEMILSKSGGEPNPHRNEEKYRYWLEKSANAEHMVALSNLAMEHQYGMHGFDKNLKRAASLYKRSAELDYPGAMDMLGYILGIRSDHPDLEAALYWNKKAARSGAIGGLNNLSLMYERGSGVAQDKVRAAALYRAYIELGGKPDAATINRLAQAIDKLLGDKQELLEELNLLLKHYKEEYGPSAVFRVACEEGSSRGCMKLAISYEEGIDVEKDLKKAILLFQQTCEEGVRRSCWHLKDLEKK